MPLGHPPLQTTDSLPLASADDGISSVRVTPRAVLIAILLCIGVLVWVEYSELVVQTSQMTECSPPIPSLLSLALLGVLAALTLRLAMRISRSRMHGAAKAGAALRRLTLSRHEVLSVYLFLMVACAMPSIGVLRLVAPCLMTLQYFGDPSNHLEEMGRYVPPYWAPTEPEAVRGYWEGVDRSVPPSAMARVPVIGRGLEFVYQFVAQSAVVPWRVWAGPFAVWTTYMSVYLMTCFCITNLFRRKWSEDDRLAYPLARVSMDLFHTGSSHGSGVPFLRDPIMWTGFSIALICDGLNMVRVFYPDVPAMGLAYPIGQLFTERPWDTLQGLMVWYKPEILGIGYLVPSDIQLTIFLASMAHWFVKPVASAAGIETPGFPLQDKQAIGAFLVLGCYFIYQARHRLAEVWRKALSGDSAIDDSREPLSHRATLIGVLVGLLILIGFPVAGGVKLAHALPFFAVGVLFLIVYSRNRAETGLPAIWAYPLYEQKQMLVDLVGSRPFVGADRLRSFSLLTMFSFMQRGTYFAINSSMHESCFVGEALGLGARRTSRLLFSAIVIGFGLALWMWLSSYYTYGGNIMGTTGGTQGDQLAREAFTQYETVSKWVDAPSDPNRAHIAAMTFGALVTMAMVLARMLWVGFPLHPVGYALASCHNNNNYMWFAALVNFIVKTTVIRIGGNRLYRRLAPGFIAFTLGHFVAVGIWSFIGLYAGDYVRQFVVWFV